LRENGVAIMSLLVLKNIVGKGSSKSCYTTELGLTKLQFSSFLADMILTPDLKKVGTTKSSATEPAISHSSKAHIHGWMVEGIYRIMTSSLLKAVVVGGTVGD